MTLRRVGPRVALMTSLVSFLCAAEGAAQTVATLRPSPLSVGESWSPLRLQGALPEALPGSLLRIPRLLEHPAPRVGLFWTAGNPAGLAQEVDDTWASILAERPEESGSYRRPLDPGREASLKLGGGGWRPLGSGGVAGRIVAGQTSLGSGAHGNALQPYAGSPHLVLDTTGANLRRTAAWLEGAGGWRVGPVDLGLAMGFETQETNTTEAPAPRRMRSVFPGVTGGIAFDVPRSGIRIGMQGRWQRSVQTMLLYAVAATNRVYELEGYAEPRTINLPPGHERRFVREGSALGVSATGEVAGVVWVLSGEMVRSEEELWYELRTAEPPKDRWTTDGWTTGLAVQSRFLEDHLLVTGQAGWTELDGYAMRLNRLEDENVTGNQSLIEAVVEARYAADDDWMLAGRVGAQRQVLSRNDPEVWAGSEITSWSPWLSAAVARQVRDGVWIAAGAGVADYAPTGSVPTALAMGPVYREWIAPELAVDGSDAWSRSGEISVRWERADGRAFWTRVEVWSLSPSGGTVVNPARPSGNRTRLSFSVGVSFRE